MAGASFMALMAKGGGAPIGTPVSIGSFGSAPGTFSSGTLTTSAAILAGDLVVVGFYCNGTNLVTVSSISDGTNTYTKATMQAHAANTGGELWYCANALAVSSGATITATFSGSTGAASGYVICASRVTGVIPFSSLDQVSGAIATSASAASTTSAVLSQSNEIVFGFSYTIASTTYSGASGFTAINSGTASSGNGAGYLDYQKVSATTAVTFSPGWGTSGARVGAMQATFKGF